ncbi:GNAT family protein [Raoultella sp. Ech2A]|uniref:GNAT family N-acetyltransferase n=1 Tax=Raoultella sp. Ech2A TaxID=2996539 RepID=UPI0024BF785F|nr:GNAT family protein [Raoultella sp. Ech2A]MDJ1655413.1 GNAT family protein [Raoultella sp. Ech2A]
MSIIKTPGLIIRPFMEKDAAALFDYLSSPLAPCFLDEKLHSLEEAKNDMLRRANDPGQFAVCIKETDHLIGHLFADNSGEPDSDTWSVGWHFNSRYAKQGFAIQSATALFQYLFNEKGARRLYAWVEDYNLASQKLCERLHMRREGCFKEFVSFERENGEKRYDNTYIYALLKKEWVQ